MKMFAASLAGALAGVAVFAAPAASQDWTAIGQTSDGSMNYWRPGGPAPSGAGYGVIQLRMDLPAAEVLDGVPYWTLVWLMEARCSDGALRRYGLTAFTGQRATGQSRSGPWEGAWEPSGSGMPLNNAVRSVCR